MKTIMRKIILGSISSLIALTSVSQVAPDTIKLDFLGINNIPKYETVNYGNKYVIKIENLNQSIFKIESKVSQKDYNTDLPDIFKGIKLPAYLNLKLPNTSQDSVINAFRSPYPKSIDYKKLINNNLVIINHSNQHMLNTSELNNNFKNLLSSCDKPYKEIEKELLSAVNDFLGTHISDRKVLASTLKSNLEATIINAISANDALDSLVPLHLYSINYILKTNTDNIISKWEKEPSDKRDKKYKNDLLQYLKAKDDNELLSNYKDSLKTVLTKAIESVGEIRKFRDENGVQDLVNAYNIINYSNFTYTSEAIKINSDEVKFDISITSDKRLPCNIPTKTTISETYKTRGGWKVDFSTGVFFNGGNGDFLGRELLYKPVNDSIVKIEAKDGGTRLLLSVGALIHIYYRSGDWFNWTISPGLSTTTALDGINLHLGATGIFGGENRFIITIGTTLREAIILDKKYTLDQTYAKKLLPDKPPTIKVFPKVGWFFSFTYNFSKFKTQ